MSAVPAHAAGHPATSHLSATASPLTVLPHNTVTVAGTVTPRGTGVVMLQRYSAGRWVQVAHKPTSASGSYSFAIKTSATLGTSIYRVTRAASSAAKAVISKTMHVHVVKTAYKVKNVARPAVPSATPIVVTGSVSPKAKGTVRLEVLQHGAWHAIASAKLSAASTYSLSKVEPTGVYALRVRSPLTATIASGVGRTVKVTVAAPAAPTASVTLSGTVAGAGLYSGPVTVTAHRAAAAGVKATTYVLDGATAKPYTAPVSVTAAGVHSFKVTVTDALGRTASATATWTIQGSATDTTKPTATFTLTGNLTSPDVYSGNVGVTINAADASGIKSITYAGNGGSSQTYTGPFIVAGVGPQSLVAVVTDNAGNETSITASWTQQAGADSTAPTALIALAGSADVNGLYTGDVTATVTSADEAGGSGVETVTYTLDGAAAKAYTGPFTVSIGGSHSITVTVTDKAGNIGTASSAWNQRVGGTSQLVVTSPDDAVLVTGSTRLVFSAVRGLALSGPKAFTFTNSGSSTLTVSNLAFSGTSAADWTLATGQATSVSIPAGGTAQVSIQFSPTDPTGCPDSANPYAISPTVDRNATLTFSTNDPSQPTGSALLSGVNSCYVGGNNEPVLDQLLPALGYTDVVDTQYIDRRYIGPNRWQANTDEIQSPYFKVADSTAPVSIVPIAHYGSANTSAYQSTGYYAAGSVMAANSTCSSACKSLWSFPADTVSGGVTTYNQNQKLLPGVTGVTTFQPAASAVFGIFSGDYSDVNFTDDSYNTGHSTSNVNLPVPHYLHDIRVYPAYGP
ncbi:MAG: hypothetical protein QOI76_4364, partial [Frankiales bacterium]|nr:hypothetical protein [Frankiales bacterium]